MENTSDNPISWDQARELIKEGFRPYVRMVGGKEYIILRKSDGKRTIDRGFGEYTEEKYRMLMEMYEEIHGSEQEGGGEQPEPQPELQRSEPQQPAGVDENFLPVEEAARRAGVDLNFVELLVKKGILKEGVHYRRAVVDGVEVELFDWRKLVEAKKRQSELMSETAALDRLDRMKEEIVREVSDMIVRTVNETVRRVVGEMKEGLAREISGYVDSRLSKAEAVSTGEIHLRIPSTALGKVTVTLRPEVVLYYGYINKIWREKTGRDLSLQDFINQIIKEHLEGCIGLYTALGREVEVST
jgi:hypothetical protein